MDLDPRTVAAIAGAAEAIHASIQTHRRAQEAHRRERKRLSIALESLRREAERHGVSLEITQTPRRESQ